MQLPALNVVDIVILLIVGLSMARGYLNGGLREIVGLLVWLGAFVIAFVFTPSLRPLMPEIGLFGDYADACLIATFLSFIALFVASLLVFSMLSPIVGSAFSRRDVGTGDQLLGLAFGAVRGAVIVLVAYVAYDAIVNEPDQPDLLTSAAFAPMLQDGADWLRSTDPDDVQSFIGGTLESLTEACGFLDRALGVVDLPGGNRA